MFDWILWIDSEFFFKILFCIIVKRMCKIIFCITGLLILILINKPHLMCFHSETWNLCIVKFRVQNSPAPFLPSPPPPLLTPKKRKKKKVKLWLGDIRKQILKMFPETQIFFLKFLCINRFCDAITWTMLSKGSTLNKWWLFMLHSSNIIHPFNIILPDFLFQWSHLTRSWSFDSLLLRTFLYLFFA